MYDEQHALGSRRREPRAEGRGPTTEGHLPTALRLLEPPERIEVEWNADAPAVVWWRGRRVAVAHAHGPERLAGDWWDDPYHRDYWRCHSTDGAFVIYRDGAAERPWYLQGWYD